MPGKKQYAIKYFIRMCHNAARRRSDGMINTALPDDLGSS